MATVSLPSNNLAAEKETKDLETEVAELMKVLNTIKKKEKMLIKVLLAVRLRKYWKNPSMSKLQRRTFSCGVAACHSYHQNTRDDEDNI